MNTSNIKLGVVITMFNEHEVILRSIHGIKNCYPNSFICLVHSNRKEVFKSEQTRLLRGQVDQYISLSDLGDKFSRFLLPCQSLCRNYSAGFKSLYQKCSSLDFIVAFCGDTLITDSFNFQRRHEEMKKGCKIACISRAIGQDFHSPDADPENGKCGGRIQTPDITDFMPQLFMIDGDFAIKTKVFSEIPIINKYTSEHCMGDVLAKAIDGEFKDKVQILNPNPRIGLSYSDGVVYQAS